MYDSAQDMFSKYTELSKSDKLHTRISGTVVFPTGPSVSYRRVSTLHLPRTWGGSEMVRRLPCSFCFSGAALPPTPTKTLVTRMHTCTTDEESGSPRPSLAISRCVARTIVVERRRNSDPIIICAIADQSNPVRKPELGSVTTPRSKRRTKLYERPGNTSLSARHPRLVFF